MLPPSLSISISVSLSTPPHPTPCLLTSPPLLKPRDEDGGLAPSSSPAEAAQRRRVAEFERSTFGPLVTDVFSRFLIRGAASVAPDPDPDPASPPPEPPPRPQQLSSRAAAYTANGGGYLNRGFVTMSSVVEDEEEEGEDVADGAPVKKRTKKKTSRVTFAPGPPRMRSATPPPLSPPGSANDEQDRRLTNVQ